jgi:hypothetical protein
MQRYEIKIVLCNTILNIFAVHFNKNMNFIIYISIYEFLRIYYLHLPQIIKTFIKFTQ